MLVSQRESRDPTVLPMRPSNKWLDRVKRRLERKRLYREHFPYKEPISKTEIFADDRGVWTDNIRAQTAAADIIQLHWVCDFLHYEHFFRQVPDHIPLVWRLADMNAFTGGCCYDEHCGRYEEACGCCPKLESQNSEDLSRAIWKRKKKALDLLSNQRLHIVTLNQWMAKQVRRSSLFGRFQCTVIPNGVDQDEFRPLEREIARQALGVPNDCQVLAFVAESTKNTRKGFQLLTAALERLVGRREFFLLIVGDANATSFPNWRSLQTGFVQCVRCLRQIYSAADVFVIPSLEDNQPNTVLESMACGTPVVGFKTGGIPEMVEDGATGLLVPPGNVEELARAIEFLLDRPQDRSAMGTRARKRIEETFSRANQVQKYFDLYSRLLQESREA